jgi:hypothetical protein
MAILLRGAKAARMLRTRAGARAVVVHSGRRIDLDTHRRCARLDTACPDPEPLRRARRLERQARADAEATLGSSTPPERSSRSVSAQRTHVAGRADQAIRTLERAALNRRLRPLVWAHCRGQPSRAAPASSFTAATRRRRAHGPSCPPVCGLVVARPSWGRSLLAFRAQLRRTGGIELAATTTGSLPDGGL